MVNIIRTSIITTTTIYMSAIVKHIRGDKISDMLGYDT